MVHVQLVWSCLFTYVYYNMYVYVYGRGLLNNMHMHSEERPFKSNHDGERNTAGLVHYQSKISVNQFFTKHSPRSLTCGISSRLP